MYVVGYYEHICVTTFSIISIMPTTKVRSLSEIEFQFPLAESGLMVSEDSVMASSEEEDNVVTSVSFLKKATQQPKTTNNESKRTNVKKIGPGRVPQIQIQPQTYMILI